MGWTNEKISKIVRGEQMNASKTNQRAKEFLSCLGNGKSIYECEAENDRIDEELGGTK